MLEAGLARPRDGLLVQDGIAGKLPLRVSGEGRKRTIAVRTPKARVLETADPADPRLRDVLSNLPLGALPPALTTSKSVSCRVPTKLPESAS